ncbi:polysaccharide lyase [Echinicola shivajiensis]|uniref:polysaccharide lyase n=1 Tax=Echinicola shivajiensis TaxID=1035916 RepID=UPI001BFC9169|nr:polysaccharide lyase [Echinicola shivajiensis]
METDSQNQLGRSVGNGNNFYGVLPPLIYEETFEGNSPLRNIHQQFAADYSFSLSTDPVYKGNFSGRIELRSTDRMVANGTRAEVLFPEQSNLDRWYSFAVYFPEATFEKDSFREIISQWHQGGAGSPPNSLQIENDKLIFESIGKDNRHKDHLIADVPKNKWVHFTFHIVHAPNDEGRVSVWMNRELVLQLDGRNMKTGYGSPRWKVGIYKWKWNGTKNTDTSNRVLFYDNIRIGNENCTLQEMVE